MKEGQENPAIPIKGTLSVVSHQDPPLKGLPTPSRDTLGAESLPHGPVQDSTNTKESEGHSARAPVTPRALCAMTVHRMTPIPFSREFECFSNDKCKH